MQSIFQQGKNYLNVDVSYLANFAAGIQYDLIVKSSGCDKIKIPASATECGTLIQLAFEIKVCIQKLGKTKIEIYEKDTNNLIHYLFVQVYSINP